METRNLKRKKTARMKRKITKRFICLMLSVVMLLSLIPASLALAEGDDNASQESNIAINGGEVPQMEMAPEPEPEPEQPEQLQEALVQELQEIDSMEAAGGQPEASPEPEQPEAELDGVKLALHQKNDDGTFSKISEMQTAQHMYDDGTVRGDIMRSRDWAQAYTVCGWCRRVRTRSTR